jgi:hypothetical protein
LAEQEAEARRRADDDVESFDIAPGPKPEAQSEFAEIEVGEAGVLDSRQSEELATDESATLDLPEDNIETQPILTEEFEDPIFEDHSFHEEKNKPRDDEDRGELHESPHEEYASAESSAETLNGETPPIGQTDALQRTESQGPIGDQSSEQNASAGHSVHRGVGCGSVTTRSGKSSALSHPSQVVRKSAANEGAALRPTYRLPAAIVC